MCCLWASSPAALNSRFSTFRLTSLPRAKVLGLPFPTSYNSLILLLVCRSIRLSLQHFLRTQPFCLCTERSLRAFAWFPLGVRFSHELVQLEWNRRWASLCRRVVMGVCPSPRPLLIHSTLTVRRLRSVGLHQVVWHLMGLRVAFLPQHSPLASSLVCWRRL